MLPAVPGSSESWLLVGQDAAWRKKTRVKKYRVLPSYPCSQEALQRQLV